MPGQWEGWAGGRLFLILSLEEESDLFKQYLHCLKIKIKLKKVKKKKKKKKKNKKKKNKNKKRKKKKKKKKKQKKKTQTPQNTPKLRSPLGLVIGMVSLCWSRA